MQDMQGALRAQEEARTMEDRETLEQAALAAICACLYYELADNLEITTDEELREIIGGAYTCDCCGRWQDNK